VRNEEECVCSRCDILISGKIIKEMPGSVASWTHCITYFQGVFVSLGIQRAMRMCLIVVCGLPGCTKVFHSVIN